MTLNQETMPAVRLLRWRSEPELVAFQVPAPGPGEVLLKVEAAGLCHSDLHLMDWPAGTVPYTPPFTLGQETADTVAALGPGAKGVREGDQVFVGAVSYVGRGGGSLPVSPASLPFGCSVHIPTWGTLPELAEVVALARTGAVRTQVECFTLSQAPDAYRRLRRGQVHGRAVVTPDVGYAPDVITGRIP